MLDPHAVHRYLLDWAALNAISVACSHGDFRARNAGRDDDAAVAGVEDDVGAVGLGEAWCALVEFLGIHEFLEGARGTCS